MSNKPLNTRSTEELRRRLEENKKKFEQLRKQKEELSNKINARAKGISPSINQSLYSTTTSQETKSTISESTTETQTNEKRITLEQFQLNQKKLAFKSSCSISQNEITHSIEGIFPDLIENGSQYELPAEFMNQNKEDEYNKKDSKTIKANQKSIIRRASTMNYNQEEKKNQNLEELNVIKEKENEEKNMMNEEQRKIFFNKNESNLNRLLNNSKKAFENVY